MDWLQTLVSGLLGAATTGIPLWIKLRNANIGFKKKEAELDIQIDKKKAEQVKINKIDTEAEWKRILEARNEELSTLRARDDVQEGQIKDLYQKHMECEKDKARNEAKLEAMERYYKERIDRLEVELRELHNTLRGWKDAVSNGTPAPGCPPSCPLLGKEGSGQGTTSLGTVRTDGVRPG